MTGRLWRGARGVARGVARWAPLVAAPVLLLAGSAPLLELALACAVVVAMWLAERLWARGWELAGERSARLSAERAAGLARAGCRAARADRDRVLVQRDHLAGRCERLAVENAALWRELRAPGNGLPERWARWLGMDADGYPERERRGGDR